MVLLLDLLICCGFSCLVVGCVCGCVLFDFLVFDVDGFVCLMCLFAMVVPLGIWGVLLVTRCLGLGLVFV